ncbi:MAG: hypothetical protein VX733_06630 [Candidatus Latescibacterota bacterium]|nr:hypothetical protein [Candidatus Latescibacterota bacterium]
MRPTRHLSAAIALLGLLACSSLERDNPVDPAASSSTATATAAISQEGVSVTVLLPLTKTLAIVVDSVVARIEGPDMDPVVKQLIHATPLGPATLTIGGISPGTGRTLKIEAYDLDGRLILSGQQRNLTIAVGDTTRVSLDLRLLVEIEDTEDDGMSGPADSTVAGEDGGDDSEAPADDSSEDAGATG